VLQNTVPPCKFRGTVVYITGGSYFPIWSKKWNC